MPLQIDDSVDISHVSGNAPDEIKRIIVTVFPTIDSRHAKGRRGYSEEIAKRMVVTEVSILCHPEELKKIGRVVCELEVHDDMINGSRTIHGGCSAFLVDMCSSMASTALALNNEATANLVSQSLNVVYHSPAVVGDKLRIVNATMTMGSRATSIKTEIWNITHHRLVASGVHIKMQPSEKSKL
ncbi:hypothetical protein E1B28_009731 [Marasmius oreades]|uniref:Thioesterase domain-containing protein n=1 Tax=Marasmius oreades TaxID=181124 RepID=A0A9P7RVP4_9AGAR|nr:uncharacterized protein E1B28_009731 [Marasmius oreades]KAG7090629.1 hypothetical protein E1B28_009731 [Marasmius oreades]